MSKYSVPGRTTYYDRMAPETTQGEVGPKKPNESYPQETDAPIYQPKTVDPEKKVTATIPKAGDVASTTEDTQKGFDIGVGAANIAGSMLTEMGRQNGISAANKYAEDYAGWEEDFNSTLDPTSASFPTLDSYLSEMPTAVEAISNSHMMSAANNSKTGANILNPAGIIGRAGGMSDKQTNFLWGKSSERAVQGMQAMGPYGLLVGGAVGLVEGIFGWKEAENQDAESKRKAIKDYEKKLKEWSEKRYRYLEAKNSEASEERIALSKARKDEAAAEKATAETSRQRQLLDAKKALLDSITSMNTESDKNRIARLERWE